MDFVPALLAPAALFLCLAAEPAAPVQTGEFRASVIGSNVLLASVNTPNDAGVDHCIGATGNDAVLERLRTAGEHARIRITYEELPYPDFRPLLCIDADCLDYAAIVRGRMVARWCNVHRFFWIETVQ